MRQEGLPPVVNAQTRLLILGSFPGVQSLARQQYYGNPLNQFWRVLGTVLRVELAELPYERRLAALLAHGVGLWDVIASCERRGSADSEIRQPTLNDFTTLQQRCRLLAAVAYNGQTASRYHAAPPNFAVRVLPSTSPAHAQLNLAAKTKLWRAALTSLLRNRSAKRPVEL